MSITLEQQASALLDACIAAEAERRADKARIALLEAVVVAARRHFPYYFNDGERGTAYDLCMALRHYYHALAALDAPGEVTGDRLQVTAKPERPCPACGGRGESTSIRDTECLACHGTGKVQP